MYEGIAKENKNDNHSLNKDIVISLLTLFKYNVIKDQPSITLKSNELWKNRKHVKLYVFVGLHRSPCIENCI